MHDIEPHHRWRDRYVSAEDERSPHFGRVYNEFQFSNRIYNYFIHPQWDEFGSSTLYAKIIFVDYDEGEAIIELIGEWNDCLSNDVLFLKQNIVDELVREGVTKHLVLMDHVLNFHGSDNCYYEEWFEDVVDEGGHITFLNVLPHVLDELRDTQVDRYVRMHETLHIPNWRSFTPKNLLAQLAMLCSQQIPQIS